ncbi:hypothetical protein [Streptomyces sp. SJL17-1]|uniref:hypothetical protein n=1 Tax=Streptomyces sp. SJL17-1 TaxID=2967223 RepID=UPI002966DC72|nr:hypothetical protein [Streptomyces sp. SJL17-1]
MEEKRFIEEYIAVERRLRPAFRLSRGVRIRELNRMLSEVRRAERALSETPTTPVRHRSRPPGGPKGGRPRTYQTSRSHRRFYIGGKRRTVTTVTTVITVTTTTIDEG